MTFKNNVFTEKNLQFQQQVIFKNRINKDFISNFSLKMNI